MSAMHQRGAERSEIWNGPSAALSVSRYDWELDPGFSGPVLVAEEDGLVVAADAALYYRDDLRRRLRAAGIHPRGPRRAT